MGAEAEQTPAAVQIQIRDIEKSYGTQKVLLGVSLDIYRGHINAVIGASGSGKTVLLRQVVRLEKPSKGQIILDGLDIAPLSEAQLMPVRSKFGMVFQGSALFDSMTVFDNVAFTLREHTKLSRKDIQDKVMDKLKALGIEPAVSKLPSELSGGMRKRVAVARALVSEPEILFYDEPTTGLDPITSRKVDELIVEMQERYGITSVVVTHDMASVMHIAHQVCFLYKGQIAAHGSPEEFAHLAQENVQEFLRASSVDLSAALNLGNTGR